MLDAICIIPEDSDTAGVNKADKVTFSIFEFKKLPAQKIALYRHSLFCPVCLQPAYFRRASTDGKQACFGARDHLPDCSELNSHLRNASLDSLKEDRIENSAEANTMTQQQDTAKREKIANEDHQLIEETVKAEQGFVIDFSAKIKNKKANEAIKVSNDSSEHKKRAAEKENSNASIIKQPTSEIKQSLPKLLTSLLRGSSLATSDVWVHTSEKHKWRAKNLFVKLAEAEVVENGSPRMYWGTISHADKAMLWLNVQGNKQIAIPIKLFQANLLKKYALKTHTDFAGANIILFAKCVESKNKERKFLQLWSNDLQFLHLSLADKL
jgi:hypothetical protein